MELVEDTNGWRLLLSNGRIQMIQIDFRLSFLISDDASQAWIYLEQPGTLRNGADESGFKPSHTVTLAPLLALFNAAVSGVQIAKTGLMIVEFPEHGLLSVMPHESYEAWQLTYSSSTEEGMLVCAPGGEIAVYQELSSPHHDFIN